MILYYYMIRSALDYIPLSNIGFIGSFVDCLNPYRPKSYITYSNRDAILGYSCRSLFDTIMKYYITEKKALRILTTPIHHTSFRNIIEKYVKPENIFILEMNDAFNEIVSIPKDVTNNPVTVDLCIVSHMFGQDLKMDILENYKVKNPNCIMIEDRVQGGYFNKNFSNGFIDMAFYSTGMDKKPCGLGGGFVYIRNDFEGNISLKNYVLNSVKNYPQQYFYHRIIELIKKIPTILIYNSKTVIGSMLFIFRIFKINLHSFASKYRKSNPGFQHNNYNKNPSNGTLISIHKSLNRVCDIENNYYKVTNKFFKALSKDVKAKYFPWVKSDYLLTPYNTISVEDREKFVESFNKLNIPVLENPTWKIFNFSYKDSEKYKKFNDSLVYIPSLPIMTDTEINYLANKINNYI